MPDFGFEGPGVRVQQVMPELGGREAAGLLAGDVLIAFDGEPVTDLRATRPCSRRRAPATKSRSPCSETAKRQQ